MGDETDKVLKESVCTKTVSVTPLSQTTMKYDDYSNNAVPPMPLYEHHYTSVCPICVVILL